MKKIIISMCIMMGVIGIYKNVNASENGEMIISNQVLEEGMTNSTVHAVGSYIK